MANYAPAHITHHPHWPPVPPIRRAIHTSAAALRCPPRPRLTQALHTPPPPAGSCPAAAALASPARTTAGPCGSHTGRALTRAHPLMRAARHALGHSDLHLGPARTTLARQMLYYLPTAVVLSGTCACRRRWASQMPHGGIPAGDGWNPAALLPATDVRGAPPCLVRGLPSHSQRRH